MFLSRTDTDIYYARNNFEMPPLDDEEPEASESEESGNFSLIEILEAHITLDTYIDFGWDSYQKGM